MNRPLDSAILCTSRAHSVILFVVVAADPIMFELFHLTKYSNTFLSMFDYRHDAG